MKKKIIELLINHAARKATGNLGKVEVYDNEILCYVKGKKIKKKEKYLHRYNIIIPKINCFIKPKHYIIENVHFDMEVRIKVLDHNCHVTFENCTFTAGIKIDEAIHLTFINNKYVAQNYKNYSSIIKNGEFCISTFDDKNKINKIEFINENITDNMALQIWLYGKEIYIGATNIANAKSIEIGTEKLTLLRTNIYSDEVEIDTTKLETDCKINSDIISINASSIEGQIDAKQSSLFINGVEVDKNKKCVEIEDLELQKQRLELINSLKKIKRACEEQISTEIKRQSLTRVLKK